MSPLEQPDDEVRRFLGNQIQAALDERRWTLRRLKLETGYQPSRVDQWINGKHAPGYPELLVLAEVFNKSVDWFLRPETTSSARKLEPSATSVRIDPPDDDTAESFEYMRIRNTLIRSTQEELWIVNRTGSMFNAGGAKDALKVLMQNRDVRLRVMLPDPGVSMAEAEKGGWEAHYEGNCAITIVALGRDSSPGNKAVAANEIINSSSNIRNWIDDSVTPSKSEILFIPYAMPTVIFISDPRTENGKVLALTVSFRNAVMKAPYIFAEKSKDAKIFEWYYQDCMRIWKTFGGSLDE